MASSRLGRWFGRGRTSGPEAGAIPDPRRSPDPASYGQQAPYGPRLPVEQAPFGRTPFGQAHGETPYGSGSAEPPVVARGRLAEASRRRRAVDQQVGVLEKFEARLSDQVREATEAERHDYARELLSRRLSVRARLEEVTYRRGLLLAEEERLTGELARQETRPRTR